MAAKLIALALNFCASDRVEFSAFLKPLASLDKFLKPLPSPSSLKVIDIVLFHAIIFIYLIHPVLILYHRFSRGFFPHLNNLAVSLAFSKLLYKFAGFYACVRVCRVGRQGKIINARNGFNCVCY